MENHHLLYIYLQPACNLNYKLLIQYKLVNENIFQFVFILAKKLSTDKAVLTPFPPAQIQ